MSEYWKSTPKYWCSRCSCYVRDTTFERKQHESTAKHQSNLKRFLRGIQNDHERGEREKTKAKDEVNRLNKLVSGASPSTQTPTPSAPSVRKTSHTPLTAADQKRQWAQLADMGINVPDQYRSDMAMPGDWKVVARPHREDESALDQSVSKGVRKRRLEDDEDGERVKSRPNERPVWGKTVRQYHTPDQNTVNDDLDALLSENKLSSKHEKTVKSESEHPDRNEAPCHSLHDRATNDADTTAIQTQGEPRSASPQNVESTPEVKCESVHEDSGIPIPSQLPAASPVPVFKKRKRKAEISVT